MLSSTLRLEMFSTHDRVAGFDDELWAAIEAEQRRQEDCVARVQRHVQQLCSRHPVYPAERAGVH